MSKLLIVSYFNLRESLLCAANALQDTGYQISHYPLLEKKLLLPEIWPSDFAQIVSKENPHIILWWYIGVPYEQLAKAISSIKKSIEPGSSPIHILYNWDDPYVWTQSSNEMSLKASLFDMVFVSCEQTLEKYISHGTQQAFYLLPGFDLGLHYFTIREDVPKKYQSDVSICCTNLYNNDSIYPDQLNPNRFKILQEIYAHVEHQQQPDIDFAIYGPEQLGTLFPKSYRGQVPYDETRLVFAGSKINICTHVVGNQKGYMSERVPLILGSGGLLWMDRVPQSLLTEEHATFIDSEKRVVQQVKDLLKLEFKLQLDEKRTKGFQWASQHLTWRHWADKVHSKIMSYRFTKNLSLIPEIPKTFDHVAYKWENFRNHTTLFTRRECWNHWHQIGQHFPGSLRCTLSAHPPVSTFELASDTPRLNLHEMEFVIQIDKVRHNIFKIPELMKMNKLRFVYPLELYWKNV